MKYLHPDIHDYGLAYLRNNAVRAILIPAPYTVYADVVTSALVTATLSPTDFDLGDNLTENGGGRKLTFASKIATAAASAAANSPLHVAFTDGASRILWIERLISQPVVLQGQPYRIPSVTCIFRQFAQEA